MYSICKLNLLSRNSVGGEKGPTILNTKPYEVVIHFKSNINNTYYSYINNNINIVSPS